MNIALHQCVSSLHRRKWHWPHDLCGWLYEFCASCSGADTERDEAAEHRRQI